MNKAMRGVRNPTLPDMGFSPKWFSAGKRLPSALANWAEEKFASESDWCSLRMVGC
jgi:hypothetical protein